MENLTRLEAFLRPLAADGLCVAFSGGVDSALLLKASVLASPGPVHAATISTPFHTGRELAEAAALASACGAVHAAIETPIPDEALRNPPDRCYHCKRALFQHVFSYAKAHDLGVVLDGSNADDRTEYRPGLRALRELGVVSPLAELGFSKTEVREMAAALGISVAAKPSSPCLATRFPYGTAIDLGLLPRVERIEEAVRAAGTQIVRARIHGDTVRLEVPPDCFPAVLAQREALLQTILDEGFARLALDLGGYRSGSFDVAGKGS